MGLNRYYAWSCLFWLCCGNGGSLAGTFLDLTASPSFLLSKCSECRLEIIFDWLVFDFEVEEAIMSSDLKLRPNQTSSADFLIKKQGPSGSLCVSHTSGRCNSTWGFVFLPGWCQSFLECSLPLLDNRYIPVLGIHILFKYIHSLNWDSKFLGKKKKKNHSIIVYC